jgi:putative acetyltransferase
MNINIRELKREDITSCVKLFYDTVHSINAKDYSPDQLEVWAPKIINPESVRWQSLLNNISIVAEVNHEIVGFIDLTKTGYLDRLYIHKDHQRKGIASALLKIIEKQAAESNIDEITTEASITAKPFFEGMGFQVIKEQQKDVNGTIFINYVMKKKLR